MSYKNLNVLKFYEQMPFNIYGNLDAAVNQIKKNNPLEVYPELKKIFSKFKKISVIDFGCGGGWLVNSLAYHCGNYLDVTGVDFNPTVIDYANEIKSKLKLDSKFISSDLFTFNDKNKYDLIVSLGVLHHTNNCSEAIKHICKFGKLNSYIFLGLYHKYGRKPFLDHFKKIKDKSEEFKFKEYKKLHNVKDEKKLYSWFRDQVLHPHETQHTFEELIEIFKFSKYQIISTSINKFQTIKSFKEIVYDEKKLISYSENKIKNNEYYPGFFITVGKKIL
tara:strand:+ start:501 stop:1331 length:831 start_codon:yes stop_codon:yes gene_type:complete